MYLRNLTFVGALAVLLSLAPGRVAAQTQPVNAKAKSASQTWRPPRTVGGQPDLQGVWANNNATPRGHWEGNTLVVDTANYTPKSFLTASSEKLHVIERFTRAGPETIKYEITIDDPATWTRPWSLMIPLRHSSEGVFEYACHEGNSGLEGILAGARADEAAALKK